MTGLNAAIGGALALAAVSTLGDLIWATWLPEHRAVYGLTHGTILFLAIGTALGRVAGRLAAGAVAGGAIGLLAAGGFYALAPIAGYSSMFFVWVGVWIALAVVYGRLAAVRTSSGEVLARGMLAAAGSGVAFYAISGIWMPFDPAGWDYALHFGAWTLAYFPGFAALLLGSARYGARA